MNEHEQKILSLYNRTRQQQPSPQLDEKVLLAAKNKLTQHKSKPKKLLWALSSAAVIVLSVNVALKLVLQPTTTQAPYAPTSVQEEELPEMDIVLEQADSSLSLDSDSVPIKENKMVVRSFAKKKAAKKDRITKNSEHLSRKMQSPMATTLQKSEVASFADSAIALEPSPFFAFNKKILSSLYPTLLILQKNPNNIQIFTNKILILNLDRLNNGLIKVTAYPQSNELKLTINWALKPNCKLTKLNNSCIINLQQTGYFDKNQLIKVIWVQ